VGRFIRLVPSCPSSFDSFVDIPWTRTHHLRASSMPDGLPDETVLPLELTMRWLEVMEGPADTPAGRGQPGRAGEAGAAARRSRP
jgi:hypothetical protein